MVTYEAINILIQFGILHALWAAVLVAMIALCANRKK
ncbi:putative holin-like toxin [Sporosarcina luteola]